MNGFDPLAAQRRILQSRLKANEKLVTIAILNHWSKTSPTPFPGLTTLCELTSLERKAVMRALRGAARAGALLIMSGPKGTVNRYSLSGCMTLPVAAKDRSPKGTSTRKGLVPEKDSTSPSEVPPPVPERDSKLAKEVTQEGTHLAPPSESAGATSPNPLVRKLWDHYHAEHVRIRGVEPAFTKGQQGAVGRAWKSMLETVSFDEARIIVTRALEAGYHTQPTAILKALNNYRGNDPKRIGRQVHVQRGVADETEAESWGKDGAARLLA